MAPKVKILPILFTTTSLVDNEAVRAETEVARGIMSRVKGGYVEQFVIAHVAFADGKPQVFLDLDSKVRMRHASFEERYTNTMLPVVKKVYPGHQYIVYLHMSREERNQLGLDQDVNGSYWLDKNWYMETWISADLGKKPDASRTRYVYAPHGTKESISELVRLLLHEGGHALVHFSGRGEELTKKYGGDPVHYLDYGVRNLGRLFEELSLERWSLLAYLYALAQQVVALLTLKKAQEGIEAPIPKSHLEEWAKAIEIFEDYVLPGQKYRDGTVSKEGSLSYRNHNPGNLRWSFYEAGNRGNFSYFNTYEEGWKALLHQLKIAADGRSSVYRPEMTIREFFQVYAPSGDNNHPETYAKFVANHLQMPVETPIKNLI